MTSFSVDMSEILELVGILGRAASDIGTKTERAHREVAAEVAAEARATAGSYPHATGRLASSVTTEVTKAGAHIYASPREGFFLEFGSPNTGGPRPWLTGPAEKGAEKLGDSVLKAIDLWGSI